MITDAQAETLTRLFDNCIHPGDSFFATQIFKNRDNLDNGHRRTLTTLCRRGMLTKPADPMNGDYTMTQRALDAHIEWFDKRGQWLQE